MTDISIFGLGYVGSVLLGCLADNGHHVIGVDVNPTKVDMVNEGFSPVIEKGLSELLKKGVQEGRVQATTDARRAVHHSQLSFVCVGTPGNLNGSLNTDYVTRVCEDIGGALREKPDYHIIVMRSTMLPGSTEELILPALERTAGKRAGSDFGLCFNPEFLREGSSIDDFYNPPYTIVGADDERVIEQVKEIYAMLDAPLLVVPIKVAEMVKYVNNAFHALKVSFANEIGYICKQQNIDSHQVMEIFCMDRKLNLSPYYLKPGFAFGGSCLPKDLRALLYLSRQLDGHLPVLESILPSNDRQVELALEMIKQTGSKKVGVLGMSFKDGTDDLRESPMVELIERLIGKGYQVMVYDKNVSLASLQGANKVHIETEIPHIASLMAPTIEDVLDSSDVIVIGNRSASFKGVYDHLREDQVMIDLVRVVDGHIPSNGHYRGIGW